LELKVGWATKKKEAIKRMVELIKKIRMGEGLEGMVEDGGLMHHVAGEPGKSNVHGPFALLRWRPAAVLCGAPWNRKVAPLAESPKITTLLVI
jgi:hypothetical protein